MDALLIERWNATVAPDDEVWHLGDVARRAADVAALLARLHGETAPSDWAPHRLVVRESTVGRRG